MMLEAARLIFNGAFNGGSFVEFAHHRAGRLDIRLEICNADEKTVSLVIHGPAELLDAFEMACSLGPYDCLVTEVLRLPSSPELVDQNHE
jgi:acylphosphatase